MMSTVEKVLSLTLVCNTIGCCDELIQSADHKRVSYAKIELHNSKSLTEVLGYIISDFLSSDCNLNWSKVESKVEPEAAAAN